MGKHDALVRERRLAPRAARRVADRLRHIPADLGIVDPEEHGLRVAPDREVRNERVVGVQDERRVFGKGRECVTDALGEHVELEVTVHLIAKKVRDDDHSGPQAPDDPRQRGLVDFEEPNVAARLAGPGRLRQERGRDAAIEVRARAVVNRVPARGAHHVGEHPRGRGLAVRARDADDPVRERGRERRDEMGIHRECDEPGERGRAPSGDAQTFSC